MSGLVHVNTPAVDDAVKEVMSAHKRTAQNWQLSLNILNASVDNYGGQGSEAFKDQYQLLNKQYQNDMDVIEAAGKALNIANDGYTETDGQMAGQY